MRKTGLLILITALSACQWVKPSEEGSAVALVKPIHVENCEKLGSTTSTVKEKVGIVKRKEQKVTDELVTLAKNEAAKMGGDTILAKGSRESGSQSFEIYRCL